MRTVKQWNETWNEKIIDTYFTPRITKDLNEIVFDKNFNPELTSTFIYGETGTGKTLLACRLALEFMKQDYLQKKVRTFKFEQFPKLLSSLRDTYSNKEKTESEVIQIYLDANLLLIDDFFTSKPTDWNIDTVYRIINHRYEMMLPTIITSNPSLEEIEEVLQDQRITSRINRSYKLIEKQMY